MEELFTLREAAKVLACSEAMVRKMMHTGKLTYVKVGRLSRIRPQDLENALGIGSSVLVKEKDHHE